MELFANWILTVIVLCDQMITHDNSLLRTPLIGVS